MNTSLISCLYEKNIYDLKRVREYQRKLFIKKGYSCFEKFFIKSALKYIIRNFIRKFELYVQNKIRMRPELYDIEAEITYLLIREFKPETIVEISPGGGWSTSWILNAIKDNGFGKLYSYDLVDDSTKTIPLDLSEGRWTFIKGDIKKNIDQLPQKIDYLFMDADHSADFAHWYIRNIFPKLRSGIPVSVHDVFLHTADPSGFEGAVIIDWLKQRRIEYFTASPLKEKFVYNEIMSIKYKLNIGMSIHFLQNANSMIFFIFNKDVKNVITE